ncbi:MAG: HAMP domain-containing sensor histidine kinase [Chloroflexota bacterium]|nr:HAMP domain-containing histidine kinase [Chloroflexota bacterium]
MPQNKPIEEWKELNNARMICLLEVIRKVGAEARIDAALVQAAEGTADLFDGDEVLVTLLREHGTDLQLVACGGILTEACKQGESLKEPWELAGLVAAKGGTDLVEDQQVKRLDNLTQGLAISLMWIDEVVGGLAVYRREDRLSFTSADKLLLQHLALLLGPLLGQLRRASWLEQAVHARDEFLSIASHDLRNPLSSMRGFAQLINRMIEKSGAEQPLPNERIQNYLQRVVRQADNLNGIIEKMLDFSRILSQRLELHPELLELTSLTRDTIQRFQLWLDDQEREFEPEKRHRLEFLAPTAIIQITLDRARISQVVTSLIHNAVKYSPEGGTVVIRLEEEANAAYLRVEDNGIGIALERQSTIFQYWKIASNSRETGLGVSLFIASAVIEQHHGELTLESRPHGGSTFIIKLPLRVK